MRRAFARRVDRFCPECHPRPLPEVSLPWALMPSAERTMFATEQYQLIDFGGGRKLERFGAVILDRPAPAAEGCLIVNPTAWRRAQARFHRTRGETGTWLPPGTLPTQWLLRHGRLTFELKANQFGHVGVFPEQAENWEWIAKRIRNLQRPLNVLNLFAYTGGSTLAAAEAGAAVVHVDAASNVVRWARRNAARSGLEASPIRWITEDARRFVERELRRGNRYDAVVLDPPSYGHGPRRQPWKIELHLAALTRNCAGLLSDDPAFVLITCHSVSFGPTRLQSVLRASFSRDRCPGPVGAGQLTIAAEDGRLLPSGAFARWPE